MDNFLPWVDIESFGLEEQTDLIIELGIKITDLDLNEIARAEWLIWSPQHDLRLKQLQIAASNADTNAQYVLNMHTRNGLIDEARENGQFMHEVEVDALNWLKGGQNDPDFSGLPVCGSSVGFDKTFLRKWMPNLLDAFHYRVIDNSTLKELCRRYNPGVYSKIPSKTEQHRVRPDLDETISEFKFYRDEFLVWKD